MMGETNAVRVKIQLIEIMKTGPGKIIHFKDMKKVSLFCVIQRKSVVSQSVYQMFDSLRGIFLGSVMGSTLFQG